MKNIINKNNKEDSNRIYLLDNFRFIMIYLVVFAHCLELFAPNQEVSKYILFIIYVIHVPGLVFVSGYCSKKSNVLDAIKILYQYIVFNSLFVFLLNIFTSANLTYNLIVPQWTMWYLLSLFFWKLIIIKINIPKIIVPVLFVVTIFIGIVQTIGGYFSLSRTICFFPFFLLGYYFEKKDLKKIKLLKKFYIILMALIVIIISLFIVKYDIIPLDLQWYRGPFADLTQGIYSRLILIIMSLISIIVLLFMIPNKQLFITNLGKKTIAIYVFHGALLYIIQYFLFKIYNIKSINILIIIVISILISAILSTNCFQSIINIIMLPVNKYKQYKNSTGGTMKEYLKKIYTKPKKDYLNQIKKDLKNKNKKFIITVNPESLVNATKDEELNAMLLDDNVSLVPDGIAVVNACKMLDINVTERIAGIDIAEYLLEELNRQKKSLYLFGAKPEVIEELVSKINKEYPNIDLLGYSDGYVQDRDKIFKQIIKLQPDVCLVALGIPHQEKLIYKHLNEFDKGIFVGVGGSFDVMSGMKKRAPKLFIKLNLEWLYRIICEPKRLKRFWDNNIKFIIKIKTEKQKNKKKSIISKLKQHWPMILILLFSLILHILAFKELGYNYTINSDDLSYVKSGITFLETGKITMHGVLSAQIMPGMTFFIGLFSFIFGTGVKLWWSLKIAWLIMSLLSILTVYKTIRLYTNKYISALSCLFFLVADYVWMDNIILTETPYMLLFSLLVYHTLKISQKPNKKDYILIVIYYLLAVFIRPNIGIFPLCLFIFLLIKKYDFKLLIKQCLLAGSLLLLLLIPWTYRNYKVFGEFIPLTYGMGNPLLLGTYQGVGYPADEELEYKTNVDDKISKEMKYYIDNPEEKDYITRYYLLEYDAMKAKYRMNEWWEKDKGSMLKSYLFYKPYVMVYNSFYWDTVLGIEVEKILFTRKIEIVLFLISSIIILIDKKRFKEWLFLMLTYGIQIALYSYTFAFSRYAITMFFIRYIVIGIGIGIIYDKIKNRSTK